MLYNHRMVLLIENIVKNWPTQVTTYIRDSSPISATLQPKVKHFGNNQISGPLNSSINNSNHENHLKTILNLKHLMLLLQDRKTYPIKLENNWLAYSQPRPIQRAKDQLATTNLQRTWVTMCVHRLLCDCLYLDLMLMNVDWTIVFACAFLSLVLNVFNQQILMYIL